jgi:hypothetical protein
MEIVGLNMDVNIFWEIIGKYNNKTIIVQIILFILGVFAFILSYTGRIKWIIKFTLGIIILFIGIVHFGYYGTEMIQKYFAFPLFIFSGILFIFESIKNKQDILGKFNKLQFILLFLYLLYPLVSFILGNRFPKMATLIMPCPIISVSIVIYSAYKTKNKLLLVCMALWGLTGVKAFVANAYEDIILLICGIYCIYILINQIKIKRLT